MGHLVEVEARKMVDTRSGRWLLAATGLLAAAVTTVQVATDPSAPTIDVFRSAGASPAVVVPLLAVLLVTSEWSQRTALTTFALVPRRERVIRAKLTAALGLAGAVLVATALIGAIGVGIAGGDFTNVSPGAVGGVALLIPLSVLAGFVLGLVLLHSTVAVCAYFLLPAAFLALRQISTGVAHTLSWFDQSAWEALTDHRVSSGIWWAKIGVSTVVWVVLPLAVGLFRLRRVEIK